MTNLELARAFYEAFDTNRPNLQGDVHVTDWKALPPVPGNPGGLAGQQGTVAYLHSVFDDMSYKVLDVYDAGLETVVARAQLSGVQVGEFLGVSSTGRKIVMDTIEIHKVADGKIRATYHVEDLWGAYCQMTRG